MKIHIAADRKAAGKYAATETERALREILQSRGEANLVLASATSQIEMFEELVQKDIDWSKITCFHLDEYVGMAENHPASFRRFLRDRLCSRIDGPRELYWIQGDSDDPQAECERLAGIIRQHPIDVACIGIGENGHLAFNDPPADFDTDAPYLLVGLDEACRRQQLGEGWFPTLADVPQSAVSMSIKQILKSKKIICTVPDERKAVAVRDAVKGPITTNLPASILQEHRDVTLILDEASASLISAATRASTID
jgi:glucosamine-6-phosphate deaminase